MTTGGDNGDGQDGGQQLLAIFWYDYYNTETSWLPLLLPFCGWCGLWVYATVHGKAYGKWWQIQLIHHVGAILGGSLSLYYDDDTLFNERNSILWSTAYFNCKTKYYIVSQKQNENKVKERTMSCTEIVDKIN